MPRELISGDTAIRSIKPGDPRKRISDGAGLYLLLFVKGGSHGWRLDYSVHGVRKTLSLGTYPDTGLALARRKADEARRLVSEGLDPSDSRKAAKAEAERRREAKKREDGPGGLVRGGSPRMAGHDSRGEGQRGPRHAHPASPGAGHLSVGRAAAPGRDRTAGVARMLAPHHSTRRH
jgi:hypothetical protein